MKGRKKDIACWYTDLGITMGMSPRMSIVRRGHGFGLAGRLALIGVVDDHDLSLRDCLGLGALEWANAGCGHVCMWRYVRSGACVLTEAYEGMLTFRLRGRGIMKWDGACSLQRTRSSQDTLVTRHHMVRGRSFQQRSYCHHPQPSCQQRLYMCLIILQVS